VFPLSKGKSHPFRDSLAQTVSVISDIFIGNIKTRRRIFIFFLAPLPACRPFCAMGSTPSSQAPAPPAALPNGPPAAPLVPGHDNPPILEGDFALLNMDVMIYLLKWFHPQAIRSFTGLSKNSKNLVHANALWKNLVEREYFNELRQFSTAAPVQKHLKTQNWLELYRVLSIEERDWRKLPKFVLVRELNP
jgi:hypothetical protein